MAASDGSEDLDDDVRAVRVTTALTLVAVVLAVAGGLLAWRLVGEGSSRIGSRTNEAPDLDFVVPRGASAQARRGIASDAMPSVVRAAVGDVIRIVNNDTEPVDVGPFRVPAGAVLQQRLTRKGTFVGNCVISPTGRSELIVS